MWQYFFFISVKAGTDEVESSDFQARLNYYVNIEQVFLILKVRKRRPKCLFTQSDGIKVIRLYTLEKIQ